MATQERNKRKAASKKLYHGAHHGAKFFSFATAMQFLKDQGEISEHKKIEYLKLYKARGSK